VDGGDARSEKPDIPVFPLVDGTDGTSGLRLEQYINNNRVGVTKAGIADWTFNYQLPVGEWKHLAFVCDGTTIKLYVNGQQTGGNINGTINMPMDMIGLNTTGAGALNAEIDELRIWNTALPESSISAYMFDTIPAGHPQYNHLVSYYRFDEGGGNTAFDSKGSLDGTIYGATYEQVFARDLAVAALIDPPPFSNDLTDSETVTVRIANAGLLPFTEDFEVGYSLNGGPPATETVYASVNPIGPFSSIDVTFPAVDLSFYGTHTFEMFLQAQNDQNPANNTLVQSVSENSISLRRYHGL
jgi:alpha-glucosidase